jgi:predicted PurR-regulated permease PerM
MPVPRSALQRTRISLEEPVITQPLQVDEHTGPEPSAPLRQVPDPMTRAELAAWIITVATLLLIFVKHLVPGVIAGLVYYLVLDKTAARLAGRVSNRILRPIAVLTGTAIALAAITGAVALIVAIVRAQIRNIPLLMQKMAEILESTRVVLAGFGYELFPDAVRDAEDAKLIIVTWLKEHAEIFGMAGETFTWALLHMVMAVMLAVMVFLRHTRTKEQKAARGPLAHSLIQKAKSFGQSFNQVVSAQVIISAINTTLTATYILILLPLAGRPIPFGVTIIFITFVAGLIPVLGNLLSNTVIVIVSLGVSPGTAIASLVFLILIHKLEYIVNSKIVGARTDSQIWEILLAIILGDALFGFQGIVMAPIVYTFFKRELKSRGLV